MPAAKSRDRLTLLELDAKRPGVLNQCGLALGRRLGRAVGDLRRAMMPIEPSPVENVAATSGQPGDLVEGLEERLVAQVEVEGGVGHLGAELLAQVGDRVAGLLLKLLERLAEPDSLAGRW